VLKDSIELLYELIDGEVRRISHGTAASYIPMEVYEASMIRLKYARRLVKYMERGDWVNDDKAFGNEERTKRIEKKVSECGCCGQEECGEKEKV